LISTRRTAQFSLKLRYGAISYRCLKGLKLFMRVKLFIEILSVQIFSSLKMGKSKLEILMYQRSVKLVL